MAVSATPPPDPKEFRDPKGKGGRQFWKPKSVEDALRQLIHECRIWNRRYREVWFPKGEPAIRFETGKAKSEDVAELVAEAVEVLETLQSDIKEGQLRLKALKATPKKTKRRTQKRG